MQTKDKYYMKNLRIIYDRNFLKKYPYFSRWLRMNRVCYDRHHRNYSTIGGKGVKVCREWRYTTHDNYTCLFNIRQYKKFERWLLKKYGDIQNINPNLIITRKNPFIGYTPRNTIVVDKTKTNSKKSINKNTIYHYQNKFFYGIDMACALGKDKHSARNLVKLINKKYDHNVYKWLDAWCNSNRKSLRAKGYVYTILLKKALRTKKIYIIK